MKSSEPQNKLRTLVKSFMIHATCFGLLFSPMSYAQSETAQALGTAFQIVKGGMEQMIQQRQAMMQQAQFEQMMQSMQPQLVPSKYFPQCGVSKAVTDFPENACMPPQGPIPPGPAAQAITSQIDRTMALAISFESFYENLTAVNQNSPQPVGLQCLEEAAKKTDAQLQDKINALTALINNVKKSTQLFDQEQRKIKEQMDITKDLLYGPIRNADVRATNLLAEFSPNCQDYYKNNGKQSLIKGGFSSLRDTAEGQRNVASDFQTNKGEYIKDLKNQLNNIRNEVEKTGIGVFSNQEKINQILSIGGQTFQFGSAGTIVAATVAKFDNDFSVIKRDLAEVGYNITEEDLDGDFNQRMTRFSKGAREYFTKQAITDCVTGEGTVGIGLSPEQIINGLRHRSLDGSTTALSAYKTALQNILASDGFIEDKMNAIAKLDKSYGVGEVFVQIAGSDAQSRTMTPYGLYQQQISLCKRRINQDDTFSTKEALSKKSGSIAERIADAERAMRKAINLENNFLNELTNGVYERVVNCEGIAADTNRCDFGGGNDKIFEPTDGQFCISHADNCANTVKACYQEADVVVQKKQAEMKALAATFNEKVSGLVAQQEFFLKQIMAQVINDAEFLKRFIPGSSYQLPDGLFVGMPEEIMNNEYGVALRNGGDVKGLVDDLPKKLDDLKEMLEGQRRLVATQLGEYIKDQKTGMEQDRQKWTQLKQKCEGAIAAFNKQAQEQNKGMAEAQGKQGEAMGAAQNFCNKYDDASMNPAAGCGKADDLAEEVYEVSGLLANSADVRYAVQEFQYHCKNANNEGEEEDEKPTSREEDFQLFNEKCDNGRGEADYQFLADYLSNEIERQMPSDINDTDKQNLLAILQGNNNGRDIASTNWSSEFKDTAYYRRVIRPYIQVQNGNKITLPSEDIAIPEKATTAFQDKINKVNAQKGEVNICIGYRAMKERSVLESCINNSGDKTDIECYNDKMKNDYAPTNRELVKAADLTARLYDRVVASDTSRLGEQMQDINCVVKNGSTGPASGPTSLEDVSAMDILNRAMGK